MPGRGTPRSSFRLDGETLCRLAHLVHESKTNKSEVVRTLINTSWEESCRMASLKKKFKESARVS